MEHGLIREETKATSQHQITIPKKIWNALGLEAGRRFQVVLTEDKRIVVTPKEADSMGLSDSEWNSLVKLAHSEKNVSKRLRGSREAISYLKKL